MSVKIVFFCESVAEPHHFFVAPPPDKNFIRIYNFVLHFEEIRLLYGSGTASGFVNKIHGSGSKGLKILWIGGS
jgi:hypothetical protein